MNTQYLPDLERRASHATHGFDKLFCVLRRQHNAPIWHVLNVRRTLTVDDSEICLAFDYHQGPCQIPAASITPSTTMRYIGYATWTMVRLPGGRVAVFHCNPCADTLKYNTFGPHANRPLDARRHCIQAHSSNKTYRNAMMRYPSLADAVHFKCYIDMRE